MTHYNLYIINTYHYFKTIICIRRRQQRCSFVVGTQPDRSNIVRGRNPTAGRRDATLVRFSRYDRVPSAHTVGGGVVAFTTFGRRRSRWSTPTRVQCAWVHPPRGQHRFVCAHTLRVRWARESCGTYTPNTYYYRLPVRETAARYTAVTDRAGMTNVIAAVTTTAVVCRRWTPPDAWRPWATAARRSSWSRRTAKTTTKATAAAVAGDGTAAAGTLARPVRPRRGVPWADRRRRRRPVSRWPPPKRTSRGRAAKTAARSSCFPNRP